HVDLDRHKLHPSPRTLPFGDLGRPRHRAALTHERLDAIDERRRTAAGCRLCQARSHAHAGLRDASRRVCVRR
ncbi:hypothetical protein RZS08_04550, partial [Arthrospira platensis SPKY1]|nr:hypothetical protein [Arthrospira platensis SPKY1]